jgi:hypothetical protein
MMKPVDAEIPGKQGMGTAACLWDYAVTRTQPTFYQYSKKERSHEQNIQKYSSSQYNHSSSSVS